jgi:hypothetical protein
MIKIENGTVSGVFSENIGKRISINKYSQADSKVDGFRFGTLERIAKSKNGYYILVSYNEGNHHGEKTISAYSLRYIVDGVIHD